MQQKNQSPPLGQFKIKITLEERPILVEKNLKSPSRRVQNSYQPKPPSRISSLHRMLKKIQSPGLGPSKIKVTIKITLEERQILAEKNIQSPDRGQSKIPTWQNLPLGSAVSKGC